MARRRRSAYVERNRVVLPSGVNPGLTIHVPKGYEDRKVWVGVCRSCDARFGKGEEQKWLKHIRACVDVDEAIEEGRSRRLPVFDEANWDPEIAEHLRKVGVQMLKEGRMVMKPNERAGFS